jgi:hypothetical protein
MSSKKKKKPQQQPQTTNDAKSTKPQSGNENLTATIGDSSFVFLSSQTFNSCDVPCIARMAQYETSQPPQHPLSLVPHFKSVARLMPPSASVLKKSGCHSAADEYFSWFLLTSACLSHGAQGKRSTSALDGNNKKSTAPVAYANFELGVFFTSQLQQHQKKKKKGERVYCFRPHKCHCQQPGMILSSSNELIHLPVPYSLHPKPYFADEDDHRMQETPSFHEITDESRCVGNMLMTPYGARQAMEQNSRKTKRPQVSERRYEAATLFRL